MTSLAEWNTTPAPSGGQVSVLGRIIAILDAVKESGGSISITDLAMRTGLPKSTVSRLVAELTGQRYLERADDGVTLGLRLFELGARASPPEVNWTRVTGATSGAKPLVFLGSSHHADC